MAQALNEILRETERIKAGWLKFAPTATFGGMTEEEYEAKVKASYDARKQLDDLDVAQQALMNDRDGADTDTAAANAAVVKGIVGDIKYGDDSDLYEACGYVRKSERKSGLTRKAKAAQAAAKKQP